MLDRIANTSSPAPTVQLRLAGGHHGTGLGTFSDLPQLLPFLFADSPAGNMCNQLRIPDHDPGRVGLEDSFAAAGSCSIAVSPRSCLTQLSIHAHHKQSLRRWDQSLLPGAGDKRKSMLAGGVQWEGMGDKEGVKRLCLVRGLSNDSGLNNCFLNVVIQCLWHLHSFREALLSLQPQVSHHPHATDVGIVHSHISCVAQQEAPRVG